MGGSADFVLQTLETIADVSVAEWDAVVERADAPVFYRHAFLLAYERAPLEPTHAVRYVVARDQASAAVVAAAPVYVVRRRDRRFAVTHAFHCFGTCIPSIDAGHAVDPVLDRAAGVARALGAASLTVANVPRRSALADHLRRAGRVLVTTDSAFALDLRDVATFDDYLSRLRRPARKVLLRNYRRGEAAGMEVSVEAAPLASAEAAVALCRRSGRQHGNGDWYPPQLVPFLEALGPLAALVLVRLDGRTVGAQVLLVDSRRVYAWAAGRDAEAAPSFSPSYVTWGESVRFALAAGAERIEAGRRNGGFKTRYGLSSSDLCACVAGAP